MTTFHGRLFGPGLPGGGAVASGRWTPHGVTLAVAGRSIDARAPRIDGGGFNAATLRLFWEDHAGAWAFCVDDGELDLCLASAPASLLPQLEGAVGRRRQVERRFRLGWGVLTLVLLLPVLALGAALLFRDPLADWVVSRIPLEQEARLGELALAQVRLTVPVNDSGAAAELLRAVGTPLVTGSPYRYRWYVADEPAVNAFAAPGGVVVVNRGLLRAVRTPEELAGVLAHEIAHAELRHTLKVMVKGAGMRALAALALGDLSGTAVAEAAKQLTELRFSREAEAEADREGVRRLVAARIDPHGLLSFFATLEKEEKLVPPAFLSTHPDTAARLDELRRALASVHGEWRPLAVDLAAVQAQLAP